MQVQEQNVVESDVVQKQNRFLLVVLVVLLSVTCIAVLVFSVVSAFRHKAVVAEKDGQLSALQQQLDTEKGKNDQLGKENDTLKSQVGSLQNENDALKIEISKNGGVYPKQAYEGKKLVALTFDDGPGEYTAELLDFLKAHRVRATFFLLGKNAEKYPELIQRMYAEGHTIGNHSYSHPNLIKLSSGSVASQIGKCNAAIYKAIGRNATVLRCPGGNANATVRRVAKNAGLPLIHWSIDTRDWETRDKNKTLEAVFANGVQDGSIILMHDIYRESVDAAKETVLRLEQEGYTFVTVPELLSVRRDGMEPGESYKNGY